ncbi:MAG: LacI family DNA-binding transcriptional regulator [Chitinophagaceae bacterium]|nr:LacI family DNA-binding transcriptional regulator [Chitinophagaceae bacterium]
MDKVLDKTEKEVTIYDLARIVKVSPATVSRALRGDTCISKKTKKKINDLAVELCYQPNRHACDLRTRKTNLIGVIVHELSSYFMASFLSGIEDEIKDTNYDLIICHSSDSTTKEVANAKQLFNRRVDGLIFSLASDTESLSHLDPFIRKNVPVVFFDRVDPGSPGIKIVIDNYKAGFDAAQHLLQQGCRRLLHVAGSLKRNVYEERWKGFQDALSSAGLPCTEEQLITSEFSEKASLQTAQKIVQRQKLPDGIFIANDMCATICMHAFKKAGIKVPEQIAIVGFNNDPISRIVEPQLTTINYPIREMGILAAKNLIEQLECADLGNKNNSVVLRSDLIIRGSTNRVKKAT